MKLRTLFSALAIVVLVLLLVSAGGFYWLVGRNSLSLTAGKENAVPSAAIFVPKQAPIMASLLVNPEQLEMARLVSALPQARRQARAELDQLKQSLLANTGLDYQRDIQPWLGQEMTLAVTALDFDYDATNGQQPGYLLAIATEDPEQSREFLQRFWQKRAIGGIDLVFEQYKGVKIISANTALPATESQIPTVKPKPPKYRLQLQSPEPPSTAAPRPTLATAAVGDQFVLFANHPKVLREAINNVQAPDLSLSQASTFTAALETLTQSHVGLAVVNLPQLNRWFGIGPNEPTAPPTVDRDANTPTLAQTLAIGLAFNQQGLLAETALLNTSGAPIPSVLPSLAQPVGALQYIPNRTALAASGTNLDRLWTQLSGTLNRYEAVSQLTQQSLKALESRWQLNLPTDIFNWVTGEYALALLPQDPLKLGEKSQPDWIFAAQRPTAAANQQAIAHLDDLARQQGLTVGPLKLGDRTVSAWTRLTAPTASAVSQSLSLQAEIQGVHASVGNYELFATSIAAMDKALQAAARPLLTDTNFQQATDALLKPNNGYLYLDWASSQPFLERRFPLLKVLELAGQPLFSHLRSLTISSYGVQSGVQRGGVLIRLGN